MLQINVTNIDDGQLIAKINEALQKSGIDIAARPEVTSKRVVTIKIGLTPADQYVAVDHQVIGLEPPDAPTRTIAFMDGTALVKQLPLFDNVRAVKKEEEKEVIENHG
ncbi:MAG: hypothetical protein IMF18_05365 [Proteobacteria bacterium]|nr:hypothetical protein [Pseudomonadota bacterium]